MRTVKDVLEEVKRQKEEIAKKALRQQEELQQKEKDISDSFDLCVSKIIRPTLMRICQELTKEKINCDISDKPSQIVFNIETALRRYVSVDNPHIAFYCQEVGIVSVRSSSSDIINYEKIEKINEQWVENEVAVFLAQILKV